VIVEIIRRMVILSLLAAVCGLLHGLVTGFPDLEEPPDEWGMKVDTALALDRVLWVDTRAAEAYAREHFPGAIHLSHDNWDEGLSGILMEWDPGTSVVVYCDGDGCESSRVMAEQLRTELGDDAVFWLAGGWPSLKEEAEEQ
jgi:rhodanese-related sulfurtransferase